MVRWLFAQAVIFAPLRIRSTNAASDTTSVVSVTSRRERRPPFGIRLVCELMRGSFRPKLGDGSGRTGSMCAAGRALLASNSGEKNSPPIEHTGPGSEGYHNQHVTVSSIKPRKSLANSIRAQPNMLLRNAQFKHRTHENHRQPEQHRHNTHSLRKSRAGNRINLAQITWCG